MSVRDRAPDDVLVGEFKSAMRRLASTVTLITACNDGERFGMAATAVSSLTTEPPSLLACVNRSASIHQPIAASGRYCVNILSCAHSDLVPLFSGKLSGEDRFGFGVWGDDDGLPYLRDAEASVFCTVAQAIPYGTHSIFIGAVDRVVMAGAMAPLLFHDGGFRRSVGLASPAH